MTFLPFAILSQLLNSVAVTADKYLLSKIIPDPLIYIFYFSLISLGVLFAIPFVPVPPMQIIFLSSISTLAWTAGAYLMFKALKSGQVQRVIPAIGAATPLILLFLSTFTSPLTENQTKAVIILIFGLIFLTLKDLKGKFNKFELFLEILSAYFFAFSYYFLSLSFKQQDFLSVLVWSRPILIPLAITFLVIPSLRKKITLFIQPSLSSAKGGSIPILLFAFGQVCAGLSELLLVFSISLANPAIVNSLQGIKYIFLIIFSLILGKKLPEVFKTKFSPYFWLSQILGISLIGVGLYLLAMAT